MELRVVREAFRRALPAVAALLAVGALVLAVLRAQAPPQGPAPVVWDKEACAHCRMLIGDPSFAAQIQTRGGQVLNFDDPGCLLEYASAAKVEARSVWFHHAREPRWIPEEQVVFSPVSPTPMGYGLGAFDHGETAGLGIDAAREHVLAQSRKREHALP
jgi:hypothetical protein